jgi:hypothetical protein
MKQKIDWEQLARVNVHPTQLRILEQLRDGSVWSPVALAREFDEPLGNVAYHVLQLHRQGFLEEAGSRPRRGAMEHFYRVAGVGARDGRGLAEALNT